MAQLEERRRLRKADRKERLARQQRHGEMEMHRDQLQVEAEKLKLKKLQEEAEASNDALNRTNEMLQRNLNDQSHFLDEVRAHEWTQGDGVRKSLGTPTGLNITPRHNRKQASSSKKNKSCTPSKTKHTVPVSRLNLDLQGEGSGDAPGSKE